jgi:ribonuclease HII
VSDDQEPLISPPKNDEPKTRKRNKPTATGRQKKPPKKIAKEDVVETTKEASPCLPRTRELQLRKKEIQHILGIDEAGRGPLAGPVVAAAIICRLDLPGVVDSKKITKEENREALYEQLIALKDVQWAVAIIDAARIDEINILQATLEGMRLAATALVDPSKLNVPIASEASVKEVGCYVICSKNIVEGIPTTKAKSSKKKPKAEPGEEEDSMPIMDTTTFYALIDGNKVPKGMPCSAESIVKGDSKEFSVAAASILAKVTRDRLMHGYDELYPQFNLKQHKGYPTAAHMQAVKKHGASPIHRRTFAPLKHMEFDEEGKIIKDNG